MTAPGPPFHSVLLVGFMGSGKSTVGPLVAAGLGWDFVDVDDLVEERAGRTVREIFEEEGERAFRRLEARATDAASRAGRRVLAPGGGWAAAEGRLESLDEGVLTVWLRVSSATAVERVRRDGRPRPLLDVPDPLSRAAELVEAREPSYRKARLHLDTEQTSPERLARDIVRYVRTGGGTARRHRPGDDPEPDLTE